jgi:hypothetical protein
MLVNMNYTIRFRPGRVNENADFLSQTQIWSVREKEVSDNLVLVWEQRDDPLCSDIRYFLEHGELKDGSKDPVPCWMKEIGLYFIRNDVLCRDGTLLSQKRRRSSQIQVVVPFLFTKQLLEEYHDSPLSGHLATRRNRLRLEDKYYWPSLVDDVKKYFHLCTTVCAAQRRSTFADISKSIEINPSTV